MFGAQRTSRRRHLSWSLNDPVVVEIRGKSILDRGHMCICLDVEIVFVSLQNRKETLKHSE